MDLATIHLPTIIFFVDMPSFIAVVIAYLLGSLSFAILVSRCMGLGNPRQWGSGNPGATNVLRSGSKWAALLTLLLDMLKGFIPVFVVKEFGASWGLTDTSVAMVALAAFLGHLYPIFFKFAGGKGVATALGVLLGINAGLGLLVMLTWLIIALLTRYSSLAAVISAVLAPLYYMFGNGVLWYTDQRIAIAVSIMSILLLWRHAQNIDRLLQGKESKLGSKRKKTSNTDGNNTTRKR